ncbi:hypothetical protein [Siccirubricoccus phaeus]|uniref:hypothetical protein n=1 Tax=Siccirubricoccus phaeus TaxID=2595053 RepID=UPI0011F3DFEA|nr:hypothetical protein [Siccirubricoccus phaeus]
MAERKAMGGPLLVAPVRARNLLWLAVLGGGWLAATIYGTPHLRVSYVWSGPRASPYYHRCSYWGLHPYELVRANGDCPLVALAHRQER